MRKRVCLLVMGGILLLIGTNQGYGVTGAEYILKPTLLWNKIVEAELEYKIYEGTEYEERDGVINLYNLWKNNLRQALMYGWVLRTTYEGLEGTTPEVREPEFASIGGKINAQLITTHLLTEEEKKILEDNGAVGISKVQGEENLYSITLPLNESIIEILKLEFVKLVQGDPSGGSLYLPPPFIIQSTSQPISQATSVDKTKIQIFSDILPLYQVVENSNKLDHSLRTLIGYKKDKLKDLALQPDSFLLDFLNISVENDEIIASILITYTGGDGGFKDIKSVGTNLSPSITDGTTSITSARVPLSLLPNIVKLSCVKSVSISHKYQLCLDRSYYHSRVNLVQLYPYSVEDWKSYDGEGVIVGIIDTGIDINHDDFKDENGKSRIFYLWDQTDNSGNPPQGYSSGTEWTKEDIDSERCRERDGQGHGTHVSGICAGDGSASGNGYSPYRYVGMAPKSNLIIVKYFNDEGRDVGNLGDALTYIESKAEYLGKRFVINLSLGGHFGAHDGTDPIEKIIDFIVLGGDQVVVAAGNDGSNRIHAEGRVFTGNTDTVTFNIPVYNSNPGAGNDLIAFDMWYEGVDTITVTVTSPRGAVFSRTTGQPTNVIGTIDGAIQIENSPGGVDPNNLDHRCIIYLFDFDYQGQNYPPRQGEWSIAVTGNNITDGRYDIWIPGSNLGGQRGFFTENSFTRSKLVGIPGTADLATTVGAYCTKGSWTDVNGNQRSYTSYPGIGDIAPFSSPGPTRDGGQKPEITAPGFGIASALSADSSVSSDRIVEDGKHRIMQGTSMSAPHVTGVMALLLQAMPNLWFDEYKRILTNLAKPDEFTGSVPNYTWGYGKLNAYFLGGIHGKVTEKNGESAILNATVKAFQNGVEKETAYTSEEGVYKLFHLLTGTYDVKVEAYGYKGAERSGIKVEMGKLTPNINSSLEKQDTTPPTIPVVVDDGIYTNNATQLHAIWSASDPESGIAEYKYAIGTTKGAIDVVDWTSIQTDSVTKTGLNLADGRTYYFGVMAKNGAGLWSSSGYSDGITVDTVSPSIIPQAIPSQVNPGQQVKLTANATDTLSRIASVTINLSPINGTSNQLMFDDGTQGDENVQDGTYSYTYTIPESVSVGTKTLTITANDYAGNTATATITVQVINPKITVLPTSGTIGTEVTINGAGYLGLEQIRLDFGLTNSIAITQANDSGSFTATFTVDSQGYGIKTITAIGFISNALAYSRFEIKPLPGSLSGKVTQKSSGNPMKGIGIEAYQNNILKGFAITGDDGKYKIENLTIGSYTLRVRTVKDGRVIYTGNIALKEKENIINFKHSLIYGGNNSMYISVESRHGRNYTYYLYPSDPGYRIYNWSYIIHYQKKGRDDGTYIDYGNNVLVIKIRLDGKWYKKAKYEATYSIYGIKDVLESEIISSNLSEYGGDNRLRITEAANRYEIKTYYLYPKDTRYKIYKWDYKVYKRGFAENYETEIDPVNNRLVIKVRLRGYTWNFWWFSRVIKAEYDATYKVYGRLAGLEESKSISQIPVTLVKEVEEKMVKPKVLIQKAQNRGILSNEMKVSIMLKDVENEIREGKISIFFDPAKIEIKDIQSPVFKEEDGLVKTMSDQETSSLQVVLHPEIDNTSGKVNIEVAIVPDDDTEELIYETTTTTLKARSIAIAKEEEGEEENIAPIAYLIIERTQKFKSLSSQQNTFDEIMDCISIDMVELKGADGNIIEVKIDEGNIIKTQYESNFDKVYCYPNPTKDKITFAKLTARVKVKIFNITGELVYGEREHYADINAQWTWDCRNNAGEKVASGIYIYILQDPVSGSMKKGKIGVIR